MTARLGVQLPGSTFSLFLTGFVLCLVLAEMDLPVQGSEGARPRDWIYLVDPEQGGRFLTAGPGESLSDLLLGLCPDLGGLRSDPPREGCMEGGIQVRSRWGRVPGGRTCSLSPLPERIRYLLGKAMDVNRAGQGELELLPGIGPGLASRILEVREDLGGFSSADELLRVPGLGRELIKRLEGRVTVGTGKRFSWPENP